MRTRQKNRNNRERKKLRPQALRSYALERKLGPVYYPLYSLFHQLDIFRNNKLEKTLLKLLLWSQVFKPEASYTAQLIVDVHPLNIIAAG